MNQELIMEKLKKPDDIVAEKIVSRLAEKKLLSEKRREEWMKKLSSETASF